MIPYPADGSKFNTKHAAWLVYAASLGGVVAPMCLLGGPILTRAAIYTLGIVGGLSAVAISAPSDRFLRWGGPLAIGLGVVFVSSLGKLLFVKFLFFPFKFSNYPAGLVFVYFCLLPSLFLLLKSLICSLPCSWFSRFTM